MKAFTAAVMRRLDRRTIESGICSGIELMSRAGIAAAREIEKNLTENSRIHILTGKGNNGGDGFIIAAYFAEKRSAESVILHCLAGENELQGDALLAFRKMPDALKQNVRNSFTAEDAADPDGVFVDAMLGTGITGTVREPFAQWIRTLNTTRRPVFAIDLPSGLNADDGSICGDAVSAQETLTFAAPKKGLLLRNGPALCGKIKVLDIGIPQKFQDEENDFLDVTDSDWFCTHFSAMPFDTYKQKRGHVLILGGSRDYPSAPFLAGEAALRSGAGMVTVMIPASAEVFCSVPKALIVQRLPDNGTGHFCEVSFAPLAGKLKNYQAVAVGPGLIRHPDCGNFLKKLLSAIHCPVIIDADALNLLSDEPNLLTALPGNAVLTPHAGEMRRLLNALGENDSNLASHEKAQILSAKTGACAVMKGPCSAVSAPDGSLAMNLSGTPALATAGSGDVLTGVAAAFAASYPAFTAARMAVFLHGFAGETAESLRNARPGLPCGLIADDLLSGLGAAQTAVLKQEQTKN